MSSLASRTARGAALTIVTGLGARGIGMVGTVVMTHFLAPGIVGEVSVATIIVMVASWLSTWGFGQYAIVKGRGDDAIEVTWHVNVANLVLGAIALVLVAMFGGLLTPVFSEPKPISAAFAPVFAPWIQPDYVSHFVPGMAIHMAIRRISSVPEKVLVRKLQFRPIALATAIGELVYAVTSVSLAAHGWGGESVVIGNIVQSTVMAIIIISAAGFKDWLTPVPLRWSRFRDMSRFGLPLAGESFAHNASRYFDNLMIARYFGEGPTGLYNMAYNLADIPAAQVGEQIAQVLLPSMSMLPPERRPRALERSTALLSLIIFPMAAGLGLVADPLIRVALSSEWQDVAPLLMILAALSMFRPVTWVLSTYLEAQDQTARLMFLELAKLGLLLAGIALLAPYGLHYAALSVGIAFGFNAIAGVWMVVQDGPSPWRMFLGFVQPLAACVVMALAVEGTRLVLYEAGIEIAGVELVCEITVGAAAYVAAALVLCRTTSRDLIRLGREVVSRRRGNA